MSVTRLGVSLEKVVATIERPASHHGTERPEAKNSAVLLPDPLSEEERGREADGDRREGDHPVQGLELHGPNVYPFGGAGTRPAAVARSVSGRLWWLARHELREHRFSGDWSLDARAGGNEDGGPFGTC
jgi:hypothetical protein